MKFDRNGNPIKDDFGLGVDGESISESINPMVLDKLAEVNPTLVERYKAEIANKKGQVKEARDNQQIANYSNVAGNILNDYNNSQKTDVILKNKMSALGTTPDIHKANRPEYDFSSNTMADNQLKQAQADQKNVIDEYKNEIGMDAYQRDEGKRVRMEDPNSEESMMARNYLQQVVPTAANYPGLDKMSASQIEKIVPGLYKKWEKDQTLKNQRYTADATRAAKKDTLAAKPSVGEASTDRVFSKEYDNWTSGGQASVDRNLKRLRDAQEILKKRKDDIIGTSGRVTGRLPDWMRSEESLRLQQDVRAAAQGSLRATLGAQFTEKEGERIMNMAYDPKLSPEANIAKIQSAIDELEKSKQNKNAKASYFENNGTLKGYKSNAQAIDNVDKTVVKKQYSPSSDKTRFIYSDGSVEVFDGKK